MKMLDVNIREDVFGKSRKEIIERQHKKKIHKIKYVFDIFRRLHIFGGVF